MFTILHHVLVSDNVGLISYNRARIFLGTEFLDNYPRRFVTCSHNLQYIYKVD